MNRDEIIRMARESGLSKPWDQEPVEWKTLERFANLVAATERERFCSDLRGLHDVYSLQSVSTIRERGAP